MPVTAPDDLDSLTPIAPAGPRLHVLIPSAGQGSRAVAAGQGAGQIEGQVQGLAKQYQPLAGQAVLAHTLAAFGALGQQIAGIHVVISPQDMVFSQVMPSFGGELGGAREHLLRCGGASRAESVLNGLRALQAHAKVKASADDWVLVHDAARCLVTPAQLQALIHACLDDPVGGLLALPLADTLKAGADGRVQATLERADKWLAQTPQMFRLGALTQALELAERQGLAVTDEASAMEAQGQMPRLVPGSAQNFKITYPDDFLLAAAILRSRSTSPALA